MRLKKSSSCQQGPFDRPPPPPPPSPTTNTTHRLPPSSRLHPLFSFSDRLTARCVFLPIGDEEEEEAGGPFRFFFFALPLDIRDSEERGSREELSLLDRRAAESPFGLIASSIHSGMLALLRRREETKYCEVKGSEFLSGGFRQ